MTQNSSLLAKNGMDGMGEVFGDLLSPQTFEPGGLSMGQIVIIFKFFL